MHQRYSVICHLTSSLCKPWFGISIVFMMCRCWKCIWVWQKKFTLEHQVRAEQKVGYISQVSSAIFPFRFSQQRRTWIITKDVLCGKFQRYIRRRQRKWKEVTRSHQPALKTEPVFCYNGKKGGFEALVCQNYNTQHIYVCVRVKISSHFKFTRSIYQKFRVDILDKKKTVTALKPGEDRAILLGLGMILSSVMMYFVLGITILRSYADRYGQMCVFSHAIKLALSSDMCLIHWMGLWRNASPLQMDGLKCYLRPRHFHISCNASPVTCFFLHRIKSSC